MSVLIGGMEMPKSCKECKFWSITSCIASYQGEKSCPLIEVHEPHGRLGDLDALAKQVEHERFHHAHTDGLAARHHVAEYGNFLKAISAAPTIIQASEEG